MSGDRAEREEVSDVWTVQRDVDGSQWDLAVGCANLLYRSEVQEVRELGGELFITVRAPWWCREWLALVSHELHASARRKHAQKLAARYQAGVTNLLGWRPEVNVCLT